MRPQEGKIDRQKQKSQWNHPDAKERQDRENTPDDQKDAQRNPEQHRPARPQGASPALQSGNQALELVELSSEAFFLAGHGVPAVRSLSCMGVR